MRPATPFHHSRQQAGKYDIRTVTGLNQSLVIRILDFQGDPVDMTGVTLRGAVRLKSGVVEFGYSTDGDGNGVISWASVPAGMWAYDVFMDKDGDESPLLCGCFISSGRVTPDLPDEKQAIAGIVVINLPDGSGCVNVMLGDAGSASYYAEQAKSASKQAQTAKEAAENAAGSANTSAGEAAQSRTAAETAARKAEEALAAIPEVDEEGNMTLKGGLTTGAMINANGGINIPLATGAPTDTAAVNRIYSAGLATVADASTIRLFLDVDGSTATNNAVISARVPNQVMYITMQGGATTTARVKLMAGVLAYNNYSNFSGVTLPLRLVSNSKITMALGKVSVTARDNLPLDDYTLVPANQSLAFGEILDITFNSEYDSGAGGYHVRVREIYWSTTAGKWLVKTTQSLLDLGSNQTIPGCVSRVVYQQYSDGGIDTDERGALWLVVTGGAADFCQRIATIRGVHNYETFGPYEYFLDITNPESYAIAVVAEDASMTCAWNNFRNPAYYGFSSVETNAIQSEAIEDFIDPDQPAA